MLNRKVAILTSIATFYYGIILDEKIDSPQALPFREIAHSCPVGIRNATIRPQHQEHQDTPRQLLV